jgi:hypothetical protein
VRALEDADALVKAEPRWLGGGLFDPHAIRAREEAMAQLLVSAREPLVVILLGGEHDLSEALAKHGPRCRYVRLTTHAYREASGRR